MSILTQPKIEPLHQHAFRNVVMEASFHHPFESAPRVMQILFIFQLEEHQIMPSFSIFDRLEELLVFYCALY